MVGALCSQLLKTCCSYVSAKLLQGLLRALRHFTETNLLIPKYPKGPTRPTNAANAEMLDGAFVRLGTRRRRLSGARPLDRWVNLRRFLSGGHDVNGLSVTHSPDHGRANLITSVDVVLQFRGRDLHNTRDRFGIVEQCGSHDRLDDPQLTLRGSLVSVSGRRRSGSRRSLASL